jgi:uncharacterized membrane protein
MLINKKKSQKQPPRLNYCILILNLLRAMLKTTPKTQLLYINIKQYLLRAMLKTAPKTQLLYINIKQYLLRAMLKTN